MRTFIDPYSPPSFDLELSIDNVDLCDSSGFLSLQDQISIITNQSEINNEFRRGMIDNYNEQKLEIYKALADFECDDYVTSQLLKSKSGDLIDKETILNEAYNAGYSAGFFRHAGREPEEPEHSNLSGGDEKEEPAGE